MDDCACCRVPYSCTVSIPDSSGGRGGWIQRPEAVIGDHQHVYIVRKAVIFGVWEGGWGEVPIIRCDVEVRVRPKLFRLVVRMDEGFKTTGLGPWTYLLSPGMVDSGAFWLKPVALQVTRMLLQQRRHYSRAVFPTPQRTRSTTLKSWAPSSNLRIT